MTEELKYIDDGCMGRHYIASHVIGDCVTLIRIHPKRTIPDRCYCVLKPEYDKPENYVTRYGGFEQEHKEIRPDIPQEWLETRCLMLDMGVVQGRVTFPDGRDFAFSYFTESEDIDAIYAYAKKRIEEYIEKEGEKHD